MLKLSPPRMPRSTRIHSYPAATCSIYYSVACLFFCMSSLDEQTFHMLYFSLYSCKWEFSTWFLAVCRQKTPAGFSPYKQEKQLSMHSASLNYLWNYVTFFNLKINFNCCYVGWHNITAKIMKWKEKITLLFTIRNKNLSFTSFNLTPLNWYILSINQRRVDMSKISYKNINIYLNFGCTVEGWWLSEFLSPIFVSISLLSASLWDLRTFVYADLRKNRTKV